MKEDKLDKVVSAVVKAIDKRMNKKPKSYYTQAEVLRVDKQDKTAYVHIPGGVDQTPATLTIDAKKGDTVQVRVGEGKAFIVGNVTNPPSDNEVAEQAKQEASSALSHSLEAVVDDTMFYLASDQDTGVTVEDEGWTEEPQEPTALLPYLWVYHRYTRGSGSTFNSDPMIIAVYTEDGVSITGIQPQYYLSTSSSSAVGGSWSNSLTYLSGYYIWTRDAISYSDGTTGYSTAVYDQALTEACSLSYNSAQYFWTKSSGGTTAVPTGSYVTEVPRSTFESSPSGSNLLLNSDGIRLRSGSSIVASFLAAGVRLYNLAGSLLSSFLSDGVRLYEPTDSTNPVAQFLSSGAIIGKENSGHVTLNSSTMKFQPDNTYTSGSIDFSYSNSEGRKIRLGNDTSSTNLNEIILAQASQQPSAKFRSIYGSRNAYLLTVASSANATTITSIRAEGTNSNGSSVTVQGDGNISLDGDVDVSGDITAVHVGCTSINKAIFATSTVQATTPSVAAGGNGEVTSDEDTMADAYPLGVVGFSVSTGDATIRRCYLTGKGNGYTKVYFNAYNNKSSAQTITCSATVLWVYYQ